MGSSISPSTSPLSLSSQLRNNRSRLKPTKTIVRDGGCVDGKEPEDTKPVGDPSDSVWPNFGKLWDLYAEVYGYLARYLLLGTMPERSLMSGVRLSGSISTSDHKLATR
jgi:hypothetical protein